MCLEGIERVQEMLEELFRQWLRESHKNCFQLSHLHAHKCTKFEDKY